MTNEGQQILFAVTNIKEPGLMTVAYWSILKTAEAVYFVQTGTAVGLGVGTNTALLVASVVDDIVSSRTVKQAANKDLNTVLSEAELYLRFTPEQYNQIQIKKGLLGGGRLKFSNGKPKSWTEAGEVKLKLSRKKFKAFLEMLK